MPTRERSCPPPNSFYVLLSLSLPLLASLADCLCPTRWPPSPETSTTECMYKVAFLSPLATVRMCGALATSCATRVTKWRPPLTEFRLVLTIIPMPGIFLVLLVQARRAVNQLLTQNQMYSRKQRLQLPPLGPLRWTSQNSS